MTPSVANSAHDLEPEVLAQALQWLEAGTGVAVVTVIRSQAESPWPVGRQMLVTPDGRMVGSVSGGWVEGSVMAQALQTLEDGEVRLLTYPVTADLAPSGGRSDDHRLERLELMVEPVDPTPRRLALLGRLVRACAAAQPVALVTDLVTGMHTLVFEAVVHGGFGFEASVLADIRQCLTTGRSTLLEPGDDGRLFVHVFGGGTGATSRA